MRVVDLSADFRLRDRSVYEAWYVPHTAPDLLPEAVYGLTELHREAIAGAGLVANPAASRPRRCSRSRRSRAPGSSPTSSSTPRPASAAPGAPRPR